jgi:hypothetical protein
MESSLEQDETRLIELSIALADQLVGALPGWLVGAACALAEKAGRTFGDDETDELRRAAAVTVDDLAPRLRRVLTADVDAGLGSPLAVLRTGTDGFASVLAGLGLVPAERDEFERRHFPDDLYGLGPATFADIDASLHIPGLEWGAARAHVHLRRRRDAETP